ncbi:hypothetical protein LSCM1_02593 [Leishmania martiniquensis]|uniref:OCRE domain-containing protein n=1 Tax=Leishmania martiniquensis TaxID=1580590 RepID=A0A836H1Y4_9TRYP|nr:hypothetical protein LSCM1_02593 [Leishmania martiniquensis]
MGCSASKSKGVRATRPPQSEATMANGNAGGPNGLPPRPPSDVSAPQDEQNKKAPMQQSAQSPSNRSVGQMAGQAASQRDGNAATTDAASGTVSGKDQQRSSSDTSGGDVDGEGMSVVLPKGIWMKTEGTPYYYSATENLYYHPPSCQFYDPTNEMWYDPEKEEWYHDDATDSEVV